MVSENQIYNYKMKKNKLNLAIFASGSGSNAENIVNYFNGFPNVFIKLILTNNPHAGVIERMKKYGITLELFNKDDFYNSENVLNTLKAQKVDVIILAGFLWLVPEKLIENFEERIINIHPALLPAYGGKGMYGHYVHEKVIENREKYSGITIHLVNKEYDKGKILFQAKSKIDADDTPETLATKIHELEYLYFPQIITSFLYSD